MFLSAIQKRFKAKHLKQFYRPRIDNDPKKIIAKVKLPFPERADQPKTLDDGSMFTLLNPPPTKEEIDVEFAVPEFTLNKFDPSWKRHLTEKEKEEIREKRYSDPVNWTIKKLAKEYNVSPCLIPIVAPRKEAPEGAPKPLPESSSRKPKYYQELKEKTQRLRQIKLHLASSRMEYQ